MPTHIHGHTLHLAITRTAELQLTNLERNMAIDTDHFMLVFNASIPRLTSQKRNISFRKWKGVDMQKLKQDIKSVLVMPETSSAVDCVDHYNQSLQKLADFHAPMLKCTITTRPYAPWFTDDRQRKCAGNWSTSGLRQGWQSIMNLNSTQ